jgi:hypothetical protein
MRTLVSFGLGALTMYLFRFLSKRTHGAAMEARRAVRTEPEPDRPSETPQSAQHLGR